MKDIKIELNDHSQTLIKFLNKYLSKAPNSLLYKWIRKKRIKVNKKKVEPSTKIYKGDIVNFYIYDEELDNWIEKKESIISKIDIDIAYENKDVIIVDKPQNTLVHAAGPEDYGKNVVDFIVDYLIEQKEYIPRLEPTFRPAIVNRIDRNTMGLVIGGKNRNAVLELNKAIDEGMIRKFYLAIVEGKLDKYREVKNTLLKDENSHVIVSNEGKDSVTLINPIEYNDNYSLVEIEILTGRTHQIRVTLADIGHPVIGDRRYSKMSKSKLYKDQQLVAYKLLFSNEINIESLKRLEVKSKYEQYIKELFKKLI